MNAKNIVVSALVALVVVALGFAFFGPSKKVERVIERLGAFPGTSFSEDLEYNGIKHFYRRQAFNTGSTTNSTVCSIRRPELTSSTTLTYASAKVLGLSTTTSDDTFRIATGANMTSTTTLLAGRAVLATSTSIVATTSLTTDDAVMSGADEWLNFDYEGVPRPYLDINGQTGVCEAIWISS